MLTENESVTRALAATGGSIQAFTPKYGAPEQFTRRYGATGPWTDVFALALVLVEVASGHESLEGDDTGQLFVSSVDESSRPTLRARGVAVSDAVEAVVRRALSVEPRQRFADADSFWTALRKASAEFETLGNSATVLASSGPSAPLPSASATQPVAGGLSTTASHVASIPQFEPPASPARSLRPLVVVAGIALVIGGGLAGALLLAGGPSKAPGSASGLPAGPVATTEASAARAAEADSGGPEPSRLVGISPGTFEMGSARPNAGELRAREVTISRPYRIQQQEVTVGDYARCVSKHACTPPGCAASDSSADAMTCVNREQSEAFCRWSGLRLPTEAEWEFAARAGAKLGIEGMSGAAAEWVADAFEADLGTRAATDPLVRWSAGMKGVLRGGTPESRIERDGVHQALRSERVGGAGGDGIPVCDGWELSRHEAEARGCIETGEVTGGGFNRSAQYSLEGIRQNFAPRGSARRSASPVTLRPPVSSVGEPQVVDDEAAGLVAKHAIHAGDGLHQLFRQPIR